MMNYIRSVPTLQLVEPRNIMNWKAKHTKAQFGYRLSSGNKFATMLLLPPLIRFKSKACTGKYNT